MTASKKERYEENWDNVERVSGRWGAMYIDYQQWEVRSYECLICGYRSVAQEKTHNHIGQEHETREKLEQLAEEMGFDDDSRIDRFRKVMDTLDNESWARNLMEPRKEKPQSEVESETHPGLDAALSQ